MKKIFIVLIISLIYFGCSGKKGDSGDEAGSETNMQSQTAMLADSLLYFRHNHQQTDILSRKLPEITRDKAFEIQLAMLEKELDAGATQIGWKMGGTATADADSYDPMFGYILDKHQYENGSTIPLENFPGGDVMVEGEIGFVIGKDFENGAKSMEELKAGIDHVVNAVEFAKATARPVEGNPQSMNINHILASGMGHQGVLLGSGKADIEGFDIQNETVKCFQDGELVAEGVSSNIYEGPLNALYSLVNLLPEYGKYLKKGDVVVTGSVYENPTISSPSEVRLEFSTLGTINFNME